MNQSQSLACLKRNKGNFTFLFIHSITHYLFSEYHNVLLIHGDKSNKQEIRNLAEHIIEKNRLIQCLTVDLRGLTLLFTFIH